MKNKKEYPLPGWATRLLERLIDFNLTEGIAGDLTEIYNRRVAKHGKLTANLLLFFAAAGFLSHRVLRQRRTSLNNTDMLRNYLKTAFRNLLKKNAIAGMNIFGMGFSMAICFLVISIIADLKSYDRFHPDGNSIYRIISDHYWDGEYSGSAAVAPLPLKEALTNYSEIEDISRLRRNLRGDLKFDEKIVAVKGLFADPNFFRFFGFELIEGNKANCLTIPNSIVLTEPIKARLFGDENALGKYVNLENQELQISGVARLTNIKSHIAFDVLVSMSTLQILENAGIYGPELKEWTALNNGMVYIKMTSPGSGYFKSQLNEIANRHYNNNRYAGTNFRLQPVTEIYLGESLSNQITPTVPGSVIIFLSVIASLVLCLSIFNYTNLTIAQSLDRMKEIGIRKSSGASRQNIFYQVMTEAMLVSLISMIVGIFILQLIIPFFHQLIALNFLKINPEYNLFTYSLFLGFALLIGILAGIFPAIVLSKLSPIHSLKQKSFSSNQMVNWKKILIGIQFGLGSLFLITTIMTQRQIEFILSSDYGFNRDQIINIPLKGVPYEKYNYEIRNNPNIISASSCAGIPGLNDEDRFRAIPEGSSEPSLVSYLTVDEYFIDHLGLKILAGKNFSTSSVQNNRGGIILNRTAIGQFGWNSPSEAIGKILDPGDAPPLQIIGVVEDFNFRSKFFSISALALRYDPDQFSLSSVKIKEGYNTETIAFLEKTWRKYDPDHVFDFRFYDEQIEYAYSDFIDLSRIMSFFTLTTILIASLGLLAMTLFWTDRRLKEIGIRKIMGANPGGLYLMLNRQLSYLVLLSFALAIPFAYMVNNFWMSYFSYKINFSIEILSLAFMLVTGLAVTITFLPSIKALRLNPVEIIREE